MSTLRKISAGAFRKYNAAHCITGRFSEASLSAFRSYYHKVQGLPRFLHDFLHLRPESWNCKRLSQKPELVKWNKDGTFLIIPNEPHILDKETFIRSPETYKDQPYGLSLVGWFIHPTLLSETRFSDPEVREDFSRLGLLSESFKGAVLGRETQRHPSQKTNGEIERASQVKYLASILDLNREHLPWLREVKAMALEHLAETYGVTEQDFVRLYFHDLYSEKHTTLHLHVRVNQGVHPLERARFCSLEDIIDVLESGNSVDSLLLRKGDFYFDVRDREEIEEKAGVIVEEIDNPFLLKSEWVPDNDAAFHCIQR